MSCILSSGSVRILGRGIIFGKHKIQQRMASADVETVIGNLQFIKESMQAQTSAINRDCRLVAVSKTKPAELIQRWPLYTTSMLTHSSRVRPIIAVVTLTACLSFEEFEHFTLIEACYNAEQRNFGENYVQELEEKSKCLEQSCPDIRWHFIGQIQSNKIGKITACPGLYCVETLTSEKHCQAFNKEMEKRHQKLNVFVQVNTSEEENKGGLTPDEAVQLAGTIEEKYTNLVFRGFMTIGSIDHSREEERNPDFERLFETRRKWAETWNRNEQDVELSMGMSTDYLIAIQHGSTSVRVGSKIFGPRLYKGKE